ncbi:MAG TPA: serine/threonine-protein kinase [Candidatus Limnocylindrales bacterium]|nr:serine/threonine-protein kinase [Candidatus Limnocylindrales bacterium]
MIGDRVFEHLRRVTEIPDLSGTHYELLAEIGRGGMGVVYRARDTRLDRLVALKVIDAGPVDEPRTLAALEHAGLVPVYDCGTLDDGRTYYAMRLIAGQRLDDYISGKPSLPARLRVFEKICDAVAFAHDRGIVHCDLKPHNIMTGDFGEVFVMDWGVANLPHAGTPRYRAPDEAPTPQTDVFALGRILEDLGPLPRPLAAVAARASSDDPAARYASVNELTAEIARFLDGLPVAAYREGPLEAMTRFARRNHVLLLLLATYLLVKFALLLIFRR